MGTMWKFQDFSVTQILREINFRECKSAKFAISTNLESLNFDFYEFLQLLKAKIYQVNKAAVLPFLNSPKFCSRKI